MKYKTQVLSLIFSILFFNSLIGQEDISASIGDSINKYIYNNPHKAIDYCYEYVNLNKKNNNTDNIILGYSALATAFDAINEPDSTLYYYHKSLSLEDDPVKLMYRKYYVAKVYDKNSNYNEALRLYNQILELAKREDEMDIFNRVNFAIELIKSKVDLYNESFPEESRVYLENLYTTEIEKKRLKAVKYTRKQLIEVYIKDNQLEKATKLALEGIEQASSEKDKKFLFFIYDLKSKINRLQKNYTLSINDAKQSLGYAKDLKNQLFINQANFNLAEIAFELKKYEEALKYLRVIEYNKNNKTSLQLSRDYKLRADTYNKLDSIRLSNKYFRKHLQEKDKANEEYQEALRSIYDINTQEQVSEIRKEKEQYKKTRWYWIGISAALLLLILILVTFFRNKSKVNQERFEVLMGKINAFEERKMDSKSKLEEDVILEKEIVLEIEPLKLPRDTDNDDIEIEETIENGTIIENEAEESTYIIDDKKIEEILVKLLTLEDKQYYLRQDCTLHNMAKKLKTNTSYLSKIINTHLDKSFSTYINELRINYAILELKNNKKLRSYSVKAIAQEMGYKNADAFTRYFKVATGITPAVYIKKVQGI